MKEQEIKKVKEEIEKLKKEQKIFEKRIKKLAYNRIDYLIKREIASIAGWASLLTKRVIKIEKELKKIKKNFY
ncbi:MAG: hypothetical protein QXX30_04855 [Candidatus Aenigmatarchaeota archaeon]